MNGIDQVVHPPKTSRHLEVEQLAYVESFDAVADKDYAFVVYKEVKTDTNKWVIRIKGSATAGTAIDPDAKALMNTIKKAAAHEEPYVVWGFHLQPSANDPRLVETRVLIDSEGRPTSLELHVVTRKADRSANDEKVAIVPWPR